MMKLAHLFSQAINNSKDIRIICETRWMIQDEKGIFIVYERKPYQKTTKILCETNVTIIAVNYLLGIGSE